MRPASTSRRSGVEHLGVGEAVDAPRRVEDHRRGVDRPGQRPAPGLVDAADQHASALASSSTSSTASAAFSRGVLPQQLVELAEALDLARAAPRVSRSSVSSAPASAAGRRVVLQELGHQPLAGEDVRHADVRQVEHLAHQRPCYRRLPVGDHHRRLEERRLERRRAARDQRQVGGGERLVRVAEKQRERQVGALRARAARARTGRASRASPSGTTKCTSWTSWRKRCAASTKAPAMYCELRAPAAGQQRDDQLARRAGAAARAPRPSAARAGSCRRADGRRRSPARRPARRSAPRTGTSRGCGPPRARSLARASAATPRPRAHVVDGRDAGVLELALEAEVEVGRVDADEEIGPLAQHAAREAPADAHDLAVAGAAPRRSRAPRASPSGSATRSPRPPCAGRRCRRTPSAGGAP